MPTDVVELCDEQGVVKNLRNFPTQYGSAFLKERETLVLLAVRQGECRIAVGSAAGWVQDCCWQCDKVGAGLLLTESKGELLQQGFSVFWIVLP